MIIEFKKDGKLIDSTDDILNDIQFVQDINELPQLTIIIPYDYYVYATEKYRWHITSKNGKEFIGIVESVQYDYEKMTISVYLVYHFKTLEYQPIATNKAFKGTLSDFVKDVLTETDIAYQFLDNAKTEEIDYVFSRQDKITAIKEAMDKCYNVKFRVNMVTDTLEIGYFENKLDFSISMFEEWEKNATLISFSENWETSKSNIAVALAEQGNGGMATVTLREVYTNKDKQISGFKVVRLETNPNNERDYTYTERPKVAPNNAEEYAIINEKQRDKDGFDKQTTISTNDISPFSKDDEKITDEDRIKASVMLYKHAINQLRVEEEKTEYNVNSTLLPNFIQVGDIVQVSFLIKRKQTDFCLTTSDDIEKSELVKINSIADDYVKNISSISGEVVK